MYLSYVCKIRKNTLGKSQWCVRGGCGGCLVLVLIFEGKGKTCLCTVCDAKIWYFYATGRPVLLAQQWCQSEVVHHWRENWLRQYHVLQGQCSSTEAETLLGDDSAPPRKGCSAGAEKQVCPSGNKFVLFVCLFVLFTFEYTKYRLAITNQFNFLMEICINYLFIGS